MIYRYLRIPYAVKLALSAGFGVLCGKVVLDNLKLEKPVKIEDIPVSEIDPSEDWSQPST